MGFATTYGDIAKVLGVSPRLVGKVLSENPSPIAIPCHRVVSSKGIGGYTIEGKKSLEFKKKLLRFEGYNDRRMFSLYQYLNVGRCSTKQNNIHEI
uniref:MGMT family protein n=1 Tax=Ignisphaera aggregans TaxID=334771 RepID=A0A7C2ZV43_9CREN